MSEEPQAGKRPATSGTQAELGNETVAFETLTAEDPAEVRAEDQGTTIAAPPPEKKPAPKPSAKTTAPTGSHSDKTQAPSRGASTGVGGQAPAPSTGMQKSATVLGDYKLLKKLGQGGMGTVYKAHQVSRDRVVAVKVLSKELVGKPAFVHRFQREARVMAALDHPNILRCLDVGEAMGYHYLAMEYVDGGSVEGYLKKLGRFTVGDALHLILACARGLHYAHEQGMVHRDIKPDNILLTKSGEVKVADLGLAKHLDEDMDLTHTGTGAGTPIYMAPEQARDVKYVDRRSDLYSLGCMLYVFLTGKQPFHGATLVELIEAKEKGKFSPIRKHNEEVPERLDLVVDKMLATRPEHRFATVGEVIKELESLGLAGERLSFLDEDVPPAAPPLHPTPTTAPLPAKSTQQPVARHSTQAPASPGTVPPPPQAPAGDFWYWSFTLKGRSLVKKLTTDEVKGLIKSGSLDAQAQVSRDAKNGFRALATYSEFQSLLKGQATRDKVEKKGARNRELFKELEEADARRRRWKWLRNLVGSMGNTVVGLLWIALLLGLLGVGGYFLVTQVFMK